MPKIIVASRYLKPTAKGARGYLVKYIATRETVAIYSPKEKIKPATEKQQQLIEQLLNTFPDGKETHEYDDYKINPTKENASELITELIERNSDQITDREIFVKYLAERPGVEKIGKHGLFSDSDDEIILAQAQKNIAEHQGNVWSHVISLTREDAERLGYTTPEIWRNLIMRHTDDIAKAQNICLENLRWYAAFHNTAHHPYIHLLVYSTDMFAEYDENVFDETESDRDLYIKWTVEYKSACSELYKNHNILNALELFQAESEKGNILALHDIGKMYRNGLLGDENISKSDEYFQKALQGFLELEQTTERIKPYVQYRIGKMYALGYGTEQDYSAAFAWFEKSAAAGNKFAQYSLGSLYFYGNGTPQNYEKAFEYFKLSADQDNAYSCYETAKMFRDGISIEKDAGQAEYYFKNAYNGFAKIANDNPNDKIIYRLGVMTFSGTGCEANRELGIEYINQSVELGNEYAQVFLDNSNRYVQMAAQNAVLSMLFSFGRLVSDDYNRSLHGQRLRTEHKLKAAIRRKKQALGLKENPLENPQFKEG